MYMDVLIHKSLNYCYMHSTSCNDVKIAISDDVFFYLSPLSSKQLTKNWKGYVHSSGSSVQTPLQPALYFFQISKIDNPDFQETDSKVINWIKLLRNGVQIIGSDHHLMTDQAKHCSRELTHGDWETTSWIKVPSSAIYRNASAS